MLHGVVSLCFHLAFIAATSSRALWVARKKHRDQLMWKSWNFIIQLALGRRILIRRSQNVTYIGAEKLGSKYFDIQKKSEAEGEIRKVFSQICSWLCNSHSDSCSRDNETSRHKAKSTSIPIEMRRRHPLSSKGLWRYFVAKIHGRNRHFANLCEQQKENVWCFVKHNENIPSFVDARCSRCCLPLRCPRWGSAKRRSEGEAKTMYGYNKHFTFRDISRERSRFLCLPAGWADA